LFLGIYLAINLKDENFSPQQLAPLQIRLQLIDSFLSDTDQNKSIFKEISSFSIKELFSPPPTLNTNNTKNNFHPPVVVCDLTDPMLSPEEASCIFQGLLMLILMILIFDIYAFLKSKKLVVNLNLIFLRLFVTDLFILLFHNSFLFLSIIVPIYCTGIKIW
jgi:hypothetical protein